MSVKIRISRERDEEINELVPDFGDSIRLNMGEIQDEGQ